MQESKHFEDLACYFWIVVVLNDLGHWDFAWYTLVGQYICASSLRNAWMTQQIATSTIWTFANVIQHKRLSCPYSILEK